MARIINLVLEVAAFFICLFSYKRFNLTRYKLFLPYLAIILLYEYGSSNKLFGIGPNKSNLWAVNIEIAFEYLFYSFFIISAYREKKEKKRFTFITLCVFTFTLIDICFIQGIMRLCSIAIVIQYGVLIIMVCRFFYLLMGEFDKETALLHKPDFWVNTGLLFFFLSEFLFFASFNLAYSRPLLFREIFHVVSGVANIILYSCLIIAFLCFRPIKTMSSSL
ncbi:hypothetical protein HQ865_23275 [Mucilaginibacter mali]|uniref:Uncharacterized protein n=1 Tax=Mucilaginibacter mali TaxID=2740462 RepID=A0A7D4UFB8_9SPHI|nr:hypothetical protein [Mucilaginibacter mali]QKJ32559.1 hypothetical protein HQ865_23275 [Mucilaginibacter mali]